MCGIIGYIGEREATPLLLEGLKRLEYRGYDSAGIATVAAGLHLARRPGKLEALEVHLKAHAPAGTLGIGHTRWATHGEPTERNAHPHRSGKTAVVHNGIIENHEALRQELRAEGFVFASDTDTEVLPHLIERELRRGATSLEAALVQALSQVEGAYAVAVVCSDYPDELVAACNSSPLVVGIGERELYLASDELAFAGKAQAVVHVRDGEAVTLKRNGSYTFGGAPIESANFRVKKPALAEGDASKGNHAHYMHKEILEQPQVMRNVLAGRLREGHPVTFGGFAPDIEARLMESRKIVLAGCGTSLFAAMAGAMMVEAIGGVPCQAEQAAEFYYRHPVLGYNDTVVGISQSGETADTLKVLELAKERHALCLGITNRVGSVLSRKVRAGVYLHAGPEVAVASTKAFTAQVAALAMLAIRVAQLREQRVPEHLVSQMLNLPNFIEQVLEREGEMESLAKRYAQAKRMIIIGRGYGVPLALEAALKIREVSYLDAHGLSASELKHGTLALVEPGTPVVAILPQGTLREKMHSNLEEVRARGGVIIPLEAPPGVCEELVPIVLAPLLQLLSYYLGVERGVDVDRPRNLAKSVTVE